MTQANPIPSISAEQLQRALDEATPPLLIDVRREPAYVASGRQIPGSIRRLPDGAVDTWASSLDPNREVVVYCVHGHEVGKNTAGTLIARGINARYLTDGIEEGWIARGLPTEAAA